jgi:glycosyltransferase involved in cell wall biosynthesis
MSDVRVLFGPDAFRQRHGGVSRYFVNLHRELLELGVRSKIFAGLHDNIDLQDTTGVLGLRTPEFRGRRRVSQAALYPVLRPSLRWARIYHDTWQQSPFPSSGHRIAVTIHDLTVIRFSRHYRDDDTSRALAEQARRCAEADVVFAVSHDTKADVVEILGVPEEKVFVTPLAADLPAKIRPGRPATVRREPGRLLYVGGRTAYKNWPLLVRALAHSPGFHLVCAGGGAPTREDYRVLAEHGVMDRVMFMAADDDTLTGLYRNAAALVTTSLHEGFGQPVLEALALGCPVISSGSGAQPEIAGSAAFYYDPANPDELVDLIRYLPTSPEGLRRLGEAGQLRAATFTWAETARRTLEGYRSILDLTAHDPD